MRHAISIQRRESFQNIIQMLSYPFDRTVNKGTIQREDAEAARQKKSVWSMIALEMDGVGADQFRQRIAWALSQILVVSPLQVGFCIRFKLLSNFTRAVLKSLFCHLLCSHFAH